MMRIKLYENYTKKYIKIKFYNGTMATYTHRSARQFAHDNRPQIMCVVIFVGFAILQYFNIL
jgi:hypothetical protein